ncbi:S8 family serine peptidase [Halomarina salina]|uniref:S8 family serine peptidase n=1 Tax=Halomarina salina TaxID=1872699 RepID=A0ABD5RJA5_9EURY|nr:S8 family serine peptidase [Halomarina salina]
MTRRVVVVALVCALVLAPVTHLPTPSDDHVVPNDAGLQSKLLEQRQTPPTVQEQASVVLRLKGLTGVPEMAGFDVERTYTREGDRLVEGSVSYADIERLSRNPRITSVRVAGTTIERDTVSPGVSAVGADQLHAAGITGENVTVGIIDSDFRMSHPAIAGVDTVYRTFGGGSDDWEHGTAVASVVADTAPGADMRLAAVGPTTSDEEYQSAVDWLVEGGADVVVDSGSYYAQPGDGNGTLARVAANASEEVVFVTSAGNHANRYWAGNYTDGAWVNYAGDDGYVDGNVLNDGEPFSGTVDVSVRWDGWPTTDEDFDIYLMREYSGGDYAVAKATGHDGQPFEHLTKQVSYGRYYVSIRAANVDDPHRVELFASHSLANQSSGGVTAPASARDVVSVGAIRNGTLQPFSARTNVDLVAPDAVALSGGNVEGGTSFAAPYVAGVAALATGANPDLNASEVRELLYTNASDFGDEGVDDTSGYGVVSALGILGVDTGESSDEANGESDATDANSEAMSDPTAPTATLRPALA